MGLTVVRLAVLVLATLATGLSAGVFWLYAHTVMPGLRRVDDRTFVSAFGAIDRAIINPWFMAGGFLGAPLLTALAAALHLGEEWRGVLGWTLVALTAYLVLVVITVAVNVPRNDALKAAGDADHIDVAAVRAAFDEDRWVRWNRVRVALNLIGFAALCWALVLHGRVAA